MTLIVLQMLGVVAGVVAALNNIEAIVVAGPLLSATGAVIAMQSFRRDLACGFYLGLASPTISAASFSLICGLHWSPRDAQVPVGVLLTAFAAMHTALAVASVREVQHAPGGSRRPLQYGISTLLVVMFVLAVVLGLVRTEDQVGIALAVLVAYGITAGYVLWRFHAGRLSRECTAPDWQI